MLVIKSRKLRNFLRYAIPFAAIPLLVFVGSALWEGRQYLLVSLGVAVLALLLFAAGFERKVTGSRRMVIASVMIALCIVGRLIPFFKPITALTILAAMYLGGEAGFLVGALSAVLSNFYFGQGPWTAFQMLAWGLIGLLSGYLAGPLKRHRALLLSYGVLCGAAYSMVMDVWTVVWYGDGFDWALYWSAMLTALPHTLLYSLSNFIFLYFLARPFGEKLERIRIKYGV